LLIRYLIHSMSTQRPIATRSSGHHHGPITRLISPGAEGALTKPFVFLDYVEAPAGAGPRFGFHPHSGIATLTFPLTFDVEHEASTGQVDAVQRRGVEWVLAGEGIWHRGRVTSTEPVAGFQLWLAMPPSAELAEPHTRFIQPDEVPKAGPVTVLLGSNGYVKSPLQTPLDVTLLWVELAAGETWDYTPQAGQHVAWCFAQRGQVEVGGERLNRELAIFEEGEGALNFHAVTPCAFMLGAAVKHSNDLVLGTHSVHTSAQSLIAGQRRIAEIGEALRVSGKL
jgi:redox-sensitive bicupin YhaK (pirin superfamily)